MEHAGAVDLGEDVLLQVEAREELQRPVDEAEPVGRLPCLDRLRVEVLGVDRSAQQLADLAMSAPETADYTTNAIMYGKAADEIVVFGPGSIDQAHQAVEWVDIAQLDAAADVYQRLFTQPDA